MSDCSGSETEEEFVLPPGFESVSGGSLSKENLENKEFWFFRVPKDVNASALHGVSFKVPKSQGSTIEVPVEVDGSKKQYKLISNDSHLYSQFVNLVPNTANGKNYVPGKPFTRSFTLVERIVLPPKQVNTELTSSKRLQEDNLTENPSKKKKKSKKHQS